MDEFVGIAVWVVALMLVLNVTVFWFSESSTFTNNDLAFSFTKNTSFGEDASSNLHAEFLGIDCSTISGTDPAILPCSLIQTGLTLEKALSSFWDFITGWTKILDIILPDWLPASNLFKDIIIYVLSLIQLFAIFVVLMRIAGIIRGGS